MNDELRPPATDREWDRYHDIRQRVLWTNRGLSGYDRNHPDDRASGHHPMLYLLGGEPIGVARIDVEGSTAMLRRVAIREGRQGEGHGRRMLLLAEAFAHAHQVETLRSHVDADAVGFYRKSGYRVIDSATRNSSVLMEKVI